MNTTLNQQQVTSALESNLELDRPTQNLNLEKNPNVALSLDISDDQLAQLVVPSLVQQRNNQNEADITLQNELTSVNEQKSQPASYEVLGNFRLFANTSSEPHLEMAMSDGADVHIKVSPAQAAMLKIIMLELKNTEKNKFNHQAMHSLIESATQRAKSLSENSADVYREITLEAQNPLGENAGLQNAEMGGNAGLQNAEADAIPETKAGREKVLLDEYNSKVAASIAQEKQQARNNQGIQSPNAAAPLSPPNSMRS